jgi:hypothetical protein
MLPPKGKYRVPSDSNWMKAPKTEIPNAMLLAARLIVEVFNGEKKPGDLPGGCIEAAVDDFRAADSFVRVKAGGTPLPGFEVVYLNPEYQGD